MGEDKRYVLIAFVPILWKKKRSRKRFSDCIEKTEDIHDKRCTPFFLCSTPQKDGAERILVEIGYGGKTVLCFPFLIADEKRLLRYFP